MSSQFYSLTISTVEQLTDDAIAVTFDVPIHLQDKFTFKQGQHLTLKVKINDEEVRRSYSICSGIVEQQLQIAIKKIEGGCFSTFANKKFKVGMSVEVMPPQGHFFTELDHQANKNYLLIAVGSGITPIISHIESILFVERNARVTLIYGNKAKASTMFDDKLSKITQEYYGRFQRIDVYSQEEQKNKLMNGRVSAKKLIDFNEAKLITISAYSDVFICGPQSMISELVDSLKTYGITDEQLFYELFYLEDSQSDDSETLVSSSTDNDLISEVMVKSNSSNTIFLLSKAGDNILDAAMAQGTELPFACKVGVCASCKAKVIHGKVEMDVNHSLTEEEVEEGFILVCQSHPASEEVTIDFDFD